MNFEDVTSGQDMSTDERSKRLWGLITERVAKEGEPKMIENAEY